ncbi:hypothetical protein MKW98_020710 [Papaver atlanticum]|uniref:Uncharacterized protein n=1 Tax=Papaver atlanticum TaxID=357466 RepID=A0AAD4TI67_9MAGN|nr:hypothetical protein MKW98_020710 [Papaver atlanticum]
MASNYPANNSIVVISPQYCAPHQVELYTAKGVKKVTESGHLGVFDINGNNIFKVITSGYFSSCLIRRCCRSSFRISKTSGLASISYRWKVYRGDSKESRDLLFSVKKSQYLQCKIQLDVFLASNTTEDICDFKIKQTYNMKSCVIYRGKSDNIIAEMHKNKAVRDKVRGEDTFSVTICPNVDYAFVIAMGAVLNEVNTPSSCGCCCCVAGLVEVVGGGGGGGGAGQGKAKPGGLVADHVNARWGWMLLYYLCLVIHWNFQGDDFRTLIFPINIILM